MDTLLLLERLIGFGIAFHGSQKLFGWFGGYGLAGTGGWLESIGYRPGKLFAFSAGLSEVLAGLLIVLGLAAPVAAMLIVAVMIVAASQHVRTGFDWTKGGWEPAALYTAIALGLAASGPGAYSLDAALGLHNVWTPIVTWSLIGLGVLGGLANLAIRRKPTVAEATAT